MKRLRDTNINTPEFWNDVYSAEAGTNKRRIDQARLGRIFRWSGAMLQERSRPIDLLDIACGLGELAEAMNESYPAVSTTGIDISDAAIAVARERHPFAKFQVASAEELPFENGAFDVVWCGETIEHLEEPVAAIAEMVRVTRRDGYIILSVPYRDKNDSNEHVWQFEPADIVSWAAFAGELVYFDAMVYPGWLTMLAVIRSR